MIFLENSTSTSPSGWLDIMPGRWKLSADIGTSDAASITFQERSNADGGTRVVAVAGTDVALTEGQPTAIYESGGGQMRCTRAGGSAAVTVRAEALPY